MEEIYISVDVEASGLIPGVYSLLSLGAAVVLWPSNAWPGNALPGNTFYAELKPINANFEKEALEINGLSMEELAKNGKEPEEAMHDLSEWVSGVSKGRKPVFASYGTFDWMYTKWYLERFGYGKLFGVNGIDMKSYYMGMNNTKWADTVKDRLPEEFTGGMKHTHNARDDAVEQADIFASMLRRNEEKNRGYGERRLRSRS